MGLFNKIFGRKSDVSVLNYKPYCNSNTVFKKK
jgi:hypothetical protein